MSVLNSCIGKGGGGDLVDIRSFKVLCKMGKLGKWLVSFKVDKVSCEVDKVSCKVDKVSCKVDGRH